MPVCRYMFDDEFTRIYADMDADLKELCVEIRELTDEHYAVERTVSHIRKGVWPFWKVVTHERYTVILKLFPGEVQCINLMSGLGGGYTRNEAGAYLTGVRAEAWRQNIKKKPDYPTSTPDRK